MVELDVPRGPGHSLGRAWPKARETQPRYAVVGLVQGPEVGRRRLEARCGSVLASTSQISSTEPAEWRWRRTEHLHEDDDRYE
jgi:hypothetical protein